MRIRRLSLILSIVLVSTLPAGAGEFPVQVEETVLENGLEVYCIQRPGAPTASCLLAVRTGSSAERPGYTGIAHFLEHMMFKGTDKIGVKDPETDRRLRLEIDRVMASLRRLEDEGAEEESMTPLREERDRLFEEQQANLVLNHIFKIYGDAGSSMTNAFTSSDMTGYIAILPPRALELFFWVEAERFRNPVFRQFHSEKNVVREERRLSENRSGHALMEEMNRVLYGSHPYAHPVIGYHEDLLALTREDMRAFFDAHYAPDNMFLVVTGDVEPDDVFRLANRYFGSWKRYAGKRPRLPIVKKAKSGPSRVYGSGPGTASLVVAYRLPPMGRPTDVEADMIAMHLGDDEGALAERLVRERGVATSVNAGWRGQRFGSEFQVQVEMKEGHAPEEAEEDVLAAIQALVDAPLSEDETAALRRRYRARILGAVKNDMRLGFTMMRHLLGGDWRAVDRNLARARTLEPEAIRSLAAEYLVPENRVVGVYTTKRRPATGPVARPAEPEPGLSTTDGRPAHWTDVKLAEKPLVIPSARPHLAKLSNGIDVVIVPDENDPVFRITAVLRGGSAEDSPGKEGAADILAGALGVSGLPGKPREAIRVELEEIVGGYRVTSGPFALRFSLDTFAQDMDRGLSLFRGLLLTSRPDPKAVKTEQERMKAGLTDLEASPGSLSDRSFRGLLWGENARTRRPTRESVDAVDATELGRLLESHRDPRRAILVVSGPVDREAVLERLEATFGDWRPGTGPVPAVPTELASAPASGLHVMDFDASQGYVVIGARALPASDPRHAAQWMLQAVLSRRLFNRIRSNEGLAYQASARLTRDWEIPSLFGVVFQTKTPSVPFGISLALDEVAKMAETGPDEEEMRNARQRFRATLTRSFGTSAARGRTFAGLLLHPAAGLDWYAKTRAAMDALTSDDVRAVAKEFLAREDLVLVCVGKRAEMEAGDGEHPQTLADFGPIQTLAPPAPAAAPEEPAGLVGFVIRGLARGDREGLAPHVAGKLEARLADPAQQQRLTMLKRLLSNATTEMGETVEEGDRATVTVLFTVTRGEQTMQLPMEFVLERIDGRWRCTDFGRKGG